MYQLVCPNRFRSPNHLRSARLVKFVRLSGWCCVSDSNWLVRIEAGVRIKRVVRITISVRIKVCKSESSSESESKLVCPNQHVCPNQNGVVRIKSGVRIKTGEVISLHFASYVPVSKGGGPGCRWAGQLSGMCRAWRDSLCRNSRKEVVNTRHHKSILTKSGLPIYLAYGRTLSTAL